MARRKRHTAAEIAAKLEEAESLEGNGRTQKEIARSLGVSVMTFHRWRKEKPKVAHSRSAAVGFPHQNGVAMSPPKSERQEGLAELRLENTRLRRLVTDLLLEKMKIEDDARVFQSDRRERGSRVARRAA
jgi:putative transposase